MNFESCLQTKKFAIPHDVFQRKRFVNIETNTEPWNPTCQKCLERQKYKISSCSSTDCDSSNEYLKALNYINSVHNLINLTAIEQIQNDGKTFNNFGLPDVPNFLAIFSNLLSSSKQPDTLSKSTSTDSLTNQLKLINLQAREKLKNQFYVPIKRSQTDENKSNVTVSSVSQIAKGPPNLSRKKQIHKSNDGGKIEHFTVVENNDENRKSIKKYRLSEEQLERYARKLLTKSAWGQLINEDRLDLILSQDNEAFFDSRYTFQSFIAIIEELRKRQTLKQKTRIAKPVKEAGDTGRISSELQLISKAITPKSSDVSTVSRRLTANSSTMVANVSSVNDCSIEDLSERKNGKKIKIKRSILKTILHTKPSLIRLQDANETRKSPCSLSTHPKQKNYNTSADNTDKDGTNPKRKPYKFGSRLTEAITEKCNEQDDLSFTDTAEDGDAAKRSRTPKDRSKREKLISTDFLNSKVARIPTNNLQKRAIFTEPQWSDVSSNSNFSSCSSDIKSDKDTGISSISKKEVRRFSS